MSSGGRGRSSKGSKGGTDRSSGGGSTHSHQTKSDHNHNEKDKENNPHKIAPTAEQLRIAQMIDNTHSEKVLQEKINQVMQVTGVSTDDAIVALHDCDYDVNGAIDSLLEGEDQGEWRESTKKKKKAQPPKSKEEAESNKENRRVENNREKSGSRPRGGTGGAPRFRGRGGGRGAKEETIEGVGRGAGSRRGRMANGAPASRGRGARGGRAATTISSRTFQKRQQQQQPPGFTETIDTWGSPPEKEENNASNLQIDNWDEEKSTTTEDWESEWTGSLDKTTVFSPSAIVEPSGQAENTTPPDAPPAPNLSQGANNLAVASGGGAISSVLGPQVTTSTGVGVSLQQQPQHPQQQQQQHQPQHPQQQQHQQPQHPQHLPQQPQHPQHQQPQQPQHPQQQHQQPQHPQQHQQPPQHPQQHQQPPQHPQQHQQPQHPQQHQQPQHPQHQQHQQHQQQQHQHHHQQQHQQLHQQQHHHQQQHQQAPPQAQSPLSDSVSSVLSMGATSQLSSVSQSYSNVAPSPASSSMSQAQTIDLAALLQKAAPHSTLGRLPPAQMVDGGGPGLIPASSLGMETKAGTNLLSGISSPNVGESLKSAGILASNGATPVVPSSAPPPPSPQQQAYSPSSPAISNSMFSNSVSSLGSSLNSASGVGKVLSLSSQNANFASRSKATRSRLPHSSKIPSKAVEMPEVAMAALDMQFTGLEFGAPETFDFTAEKPLMGGNLVSGSSVSTRGDPSSASVSVSKDLSGLTPTISQPQSLGPQPIPFPSQSAERKQQPSLLSGPQRPSNATASAQSLADLTKKDAPSAGGPSLGSLVGSAPSGHSPYQSASAGYGPKASSFPSPPAHYAQNPSQSYSNSTSSGVSNSSYAGPSVNSNSSGSASGGSNSSQPGGGYGSSFSAQVSAASGQYQNNYVSVSSHSLPSMNVSKAHGALKDSSQNYNDTSGNTSNLSGSLATSGGATNSGSSLSVSLSSATTSSVQPSKPSVPGKTVNNLGGSIPPGVQQHSVSQQQQQQQQQHQQHQHPMSQQQLNQHHQSHHHLQQQQPVAQQTQQTQQLMAGPSQYVSPQQAALQGALPPPFYNVQQPAMYSFEDLQLLQQRIPHMPQAPSSLPGGREGAITSPPSYSVAEANKFRTDQNSSPVPSTINQQGAAAGATYITAPGNAGMPPFYMMPAVPSTFSQYGAPAIIQIPSNTHTGSTTTQFPGPPKIPYAQTSTYYDSMSQPQDYKTGYGSGSQGQTKTGPNSSGSASNSGSELSYKNHLGKVSRPYEKPAFHTGTPPPFNLAGSGTSPMAANYTQMFIPTMPAGAQHHSPLMHHQLHQDGGSSAGQRTGTAGGQNKGGSKGAYSGSYWGN